MMMDDKYEYLIVPKHLRYWVNSFQSESCAMFANVKDLADGYIFLEITTEIFDDDKFFLETTRITSSRRIFHVLHYLKKHVGLEKLPKLLANDICRASELISFGNWDLSLALLSFLYKLEDTRGRNHSRRCYFSNHLPSIVGSSDSHRSDIGPMNHDPSSTVVDKRTNNSLGRVQRQTPRPFNASNVTVNGESEDHSEGKVVPNPRRRRTLLSEGCAPPLRVSSTDISDRRMAHWMDPRAVTTVDAPSDGMMAALRAWLHKLHLGNSVDSVCPSDVKLLQEDNHDLSVFYDGVFLSQVIAALLRENKECVKQVESVDEHGKKDPPTLLLTGSELHVRSRAQAMRNYQVCLRVLRSSPFNLSLDVVAEDFLSSSFPTAAVALWKVLVEIFNNQHHTIHSINDGHETTKLNMASLKRGYPIKKAIQISQAHKPWGNNRSWSAPARSSCCIKSIGVAPPSSDMGLEDVENSHPNYRHASRRVQQGQVKALNFNAAPLQSSNLSQWPRSLSPPSSKYSKTSTLSGPDFIRRNNSGTDQHHHSYEVGVMDVEPVRQIWQREDDKTNKLEVRKLEMAKSRSLARQHRSSLQYRRKIAVPTAAFPSEPMAVDVAKSRRGSRRESIACGPSKTQVKGLWMPPTMHLELSEVAFNETFSSVTVPVQNAVRDWLFSLGISVRDGEGGYYYHGNKVSAATTTNNRTSGVGYGAGVAMLDGAVIKNTVGGSIVGEKSGVANNYVGPQKLSVVMCGDPLPLKNDRLRNGELICDLFAFLEPTAASHANIMALVHRQPKSLSQARENIERGSWLFRIRKCPPIPHVLLCRSGDILKGSKNVLWGLLWEIMQAYRGVDGKCFSNIGQSLGPAQLASPTDMMLQLSHQHAADKIVSPWFAHANKTYIASGQAFPDDGPVAPCRGSITARTSCYLHSLPYTRLERQQLDVSLVHWLLGLGILSAFVVGFNPPSSIIALEGPIRDGTLFCVIVETAFRISIKGWNKRPHTFAQCVSNMVKCTACLRALPQMRARFLWPSVEECVVRGDWDVILGLLEDLHWCADHSGVVCKIAGMSFGRAPYLGSFSLQYRVVDSRSGILRGGSQSGNADCSFGQKFNPSLANATSTNPWLHQGNGTNGNSSENLVVDEGVDGNVLGMKLVPIEEKSFDHEMVIAVTDSKSELQPHDHEIGHEAEMVDSEIVRSSKGTNSFNDPPSPNQSSLMTHSVSHLTSHDAAMVELGFSQTPPIKAELRHDKLGVKSPWVARWDECETKGPGCAISDGESTVMNILGDDMTGKGSSSDALLREIDSVLSNRDLRHESGHDDNSLTSKYFAEQYSVCASTDIFPYKVGENSHNGQQQYQEISGHNELNNVGSTNPHQISGLESGLSPTKLCVDVVSQRQRPGLSTPPATIVRSPAPAISSPGPRVLTRAAKFSTASLSSTQILHNGTMTYVHRADRSRSYVDKVDSPANRRNMSPSSKELFALGMDSCVGNISKCSQEAVPGQRRLVAWANVFDEAHSLITGSPSADATGSVIHASSPCSVADDVDNTRSIATSDNGIGSLKHQRGASSVLKWIRSLGLTVRDEGALLSGGVNKIVEFSDGVLLCQLAQRLTRVAALPGFVIEPKSPAQKVQNIRRALDAFTCSTNRIPSTFLGFEVQQRFCEGDGPTIIDTLLRVKKAFKGHVS